MTLRLVYLSSTGLKRRGGCGPASHTASVLSTASPRVLGSGEVSVRVAAARKDAFSRGPR